MQAHRAECAVRDRRLKVREEEIKRRNADLVHLLRKARKHELALKDKAAKENASPAAGDFAPPPWEPQRSPPSWQPPGAGDEELAALELAASAGAAAPDAALAAPKPLGSPSPSRELLYRPASEAGSPGKPDEPKKRDVAQDEFKAVLRRVQAMEDELVEELRAFDGSREQEEADAVEAALKDVQAAERLVLAAEGLTSSGSRPSSAQPAPPRPYAARNLPERSPVGDAATPTRPGRAARPASAGPVRAEEAWAAAVADGPAPAADEPAPVYTIRQHEFDIPEFNTKPDDKTPQLMQSNADY